MLHPKTVLPLVRHNIPIRIRNTFNPVHPGTLIDNSGDRAASRAVTAIRGLSLINVGGPGMLGLTGVAGRIFSAVARARTNVLLISQASSEQSVCLVVADDEAPAAVMELRRELSSEFSAHDVEHIGILANVVIVAIVGSGMRGTPGISGRVFGALGDAGVNVIAIAQGSSENNISLVVTDTDADHAVRAVHAAAVPS